MRGVRFLHLWILCGALLERSTVVAFQPLTLTKPVRSTSSLSPSPLRQQSTSRLFLSDSDDAPRRKKRVKRKEATETEEGEVEEESPSVSAPVIPELKPRDDGPVQLQVQDVRDLVGGGAPKTAVATSSESPTVTNNTPSSSSSSVSEGLSEDSLRMLLEDAKEFQSSSVAAGSDDENGFSIPDTFKNILSTIVTIDFFVVCAFLVWFLAGIFCSYILKDDTVQIAFNRKFLCWN